MLCLQNCVLSEDANRSDRDERKRKAVDSRLLGTLRSAPAELH